MKKSLLALAVLGAFAGVAQAQTSVTIYGSFDGGVRYQSNQNTAGDTKWSMGSNGTYNSNRLGFKGVEDLGGGLNAHFNLETGFNTGTGELNVGNGPNGLTQIWQRTASVGLGGAWGSVDLGRQYTVAFRTVAAYDPFNYKYTAIIPTTGASITAGTRANNDIQYTGVFGPITARAEYALGEQVGGISNGAQAAIGVSYDNGPLALGAAYTKRKPSIVGAGVAPAPAGAVAAFQDNKDYTLGASYKFGTVRVSGGWADERQSTAGADIRQKNAWLGAGFDISPVMALTAAYYDTKYINVNGGGADGRRGLFIVGGTYALSKRTNFYADVDFAKYKDAAAGVGAGPVVGQLSATSPVGQDRQTGVSVGINHLF
jgi:predicted porin